MFLHYFIVAERFVDNCFFAVISANKASSGITARVGGGDRIDLGSSFWHIKKRNHLMRPTLRSRRFQVVRAVTVPLRGPLLTPPMLKLPSFIGRGMPATV